MSDSDASAIYTYQLRVRSLTSRRVSDLIDTIQGLTASLADDLNDLQPGLKITVQREKAIPIDPVTVLILIELTNLTLKPLLEGFFKKLGERMAESITDHVDNVQVSVAKVPKQAPEKPDEDKPTKAG